MAPSTVEREAKVSKGKREGRKKSVLGLPVVCEKSTRKKGRSQPDANSSSEERETHSTGVADVGDHVARRRTMRDEVGGSEGFD